MVGDAPYLCLDPLQYGFWDFHTWSFKKRKKKEKKGKYIFSFLFFFLFFFLNNHVWKSQNPYCRGSRHRYGASLTIFFKMIPIVVMEWFDLREPPFHGLLAVNSLFGSFQVLWPLATTICGSLYVKKVLCATNTVPSGGKTPYYDVISTDSP